MLGAGLLAKKAVERGLRRKPWVKTSLAPGSTVVTEYLEQAGLDEYLDTAPVQPRRLRLHDLHRQLRPAAGGDLEGGQRQRPRRLLGALRQPQLRGPDQPGHAANYLASPPLVVAYALAGRMDIDLTSEPLGSDSDGEPVYLSRHLAELGGDQGGRRRRSSRADMFTKSYARRLHRRRALARDRGPGGRPLHLARLDLRPQAPLLRGDGPPSRRRSSRSRARGCWPCSATRSPPTTSRRPGRSRRTARPGKWLIEQGVEVRDFNSYGSRRGNHEVMIRGTFANVRLRNRLVEQRGRLHPALPRRRGDDDLRGGDELRRRGRAAGRARRQGVRLGLLARLGGEGHQAARRPRGDRRELRADPPLQPDRDGRAAAAVPGRRVDRLARPDAARRPSTSATSQNGEAKTVEVTAHRDGADDVTFEATVRIDTPNEVSYFQNGGILHRVLRDLRSAA